MFAAQPRDRRPDAALRASLLRCANTRSPKVLEHVKATLLHENVLEWRALELLPALEADEVRLVTLVGVTTHVRVLPVVLPPLGLSLSCRPSAAVPTRRRRARLGFGAPACAATRAPRTVEVRAARSPRPRALRAGVSTGRATPSQRSADLSSSTAASVVATMTMRSVRPSSASATTGAAESRVPRRRRATQQHRRSGYQLFAQPRLGSANAVLAELRIQLAEVVVGTKAVRTRNGARIARREQPAHSWRSTGNAHAGRRSLGGAGLGFGAWVVDILVPVSVNRRCRGIGGLGASGPKHGQQEERARVVHD